MRTKTALFVFVAGILLVLNAGADDPEPVLSGTVHLDTRSNTVDWSDACKLNTKEIVGTMILMR